LFQGLTPLQISEIARRAERVIYNPGAMIIEENAEGDAAVLIISGKTVRVSGPELTSRTSPVAEGSLLGEFAMLVETTYSSTVVARGQVRALRTTRSDCRGSRSRGSPCPKNRRAIVANGRSAAPDRRDAFTLGRCDSEIVRKQKYTTRTSGEFRGCPLNPRLPTEPKANKTTRNAQPRGEGLGARALSRVVPGGKPTPQVMSFG
jgi:hypothetical protein